MARGGELSILISFTKAELLHGAKGYELQLVLEVAGQPGLLIIREGELDAGGKPFAPWDLQKMEKDLNASISAPHP